MEAKDRIIVALDFPTIQKAFLPAKKLGEHAWGFKIGLELIHSEKGGPAAVRTIQGWASSHIFYDCKLHDIPQQVADAVRNLAPLQLKMFTVHCLGGLEMMQAARQAAEEEAERIGIPRPMILGVTILTSLDFEAMLRIGFARKDDRWNSGAPISSQELERIWIESRVVQLAKLAQEAGLDGVVASAQEAKAIRQIWPDCVTVTPGIRSSDAPPDDQKRTATVAEAIRTGADYLVVGRPITQAPDPVEAAQKIASEIEKAQKEVSK